MNTIPEQYRSKTPEKGLAHMIEEIGEVMEVAGRVTAAAGKTLRFGPESANPELPANEQETNIEWLAREIADLRRALDAFEELCRTSN